MRLTRTQAIQSICTHKVLSSSIWELHHQILGYVYWPNEVVIEDEVLEDSGILYPSSSLERLNQISSYDLLENLDIKDILADEPLVRAIYIFAFIANFQLLKNASNMYLLYKVQTIAGDKTDYSLIPEPEPSLMTCACCGYNCISKSFQICPVCLWEEEAHRDLDVSSNSNKGISLRQARSNFEIFRVMSKECFVPHLEDNLMYQRLPDWEALRDTLYPLQSIDEEEDPISFESLQQEEKIIHVVNYLLLDMDTQKIKMIIEKNSKKTLAKNSHLIPASTLIFLQQTNALSIPISPVYYFLIQTYLLEQIELLQDENKQLFLNNVSNAIEILKDLKIRA